MNGQQFIVERRGVRVPSAAVGVVCVSVVWRCGGRHAGDGAGERLLGVGRGGGRAALPLGTRLWCAALYVAEHALVCNTSRGDEPGTCSLEVTSERARVHVVWRGSTSWCACLVSDVAPWSGPVGGATVVTIGGARLGGASYESLGCRFVRALWAVCASRQLWRRRLHLCMALTACGACRHLGCRRGGHASSCRASA